ncbi:jg15679 [Pararge aegeria aegeria]|uniref:Jg15679 protein n=1 Tax=Pararge aegeria aegeria TaxID=348720 RepID=A0A8S4SB31_9NEOP|nr:jg15679 [Pararge aegeria aegeria]
MERSMLGLRVKDRVNNKKIRKKTKLVDVTKRIRILKWNWAGHVCRLQPERWTNKVIEWVPRNETRKRGRPRKRWRDIFHQWCGPDWMRKARDRKLWRDLGEAYAVEAT